MMPKSTVNWEHQPCYSFFGYLLRKCVNSDYKKIGDQWTKALYEESQLDRFKKAFFGEANKKDRNTPCKVCNRLLTLDEPQLNHILVLIVLEGNELQIICLNALKEVWKYITKRN